MAKKAPNYTPEMENALTSGYSPLNTDEEREQFIHEFGEEHGKTVNSVRAKLASLGIYIKPEERVAAMSPKVTKAQLAEQIGGQMGWPAGETFNLEAASKKALRELSARLAQFAETSE